MRPTPDKMSAFMALLKKKMNFKSLVITLAAIVVFTTTYLLVLPAFTLDKEEAAEQGGIDVAVEQTVETVDEEAPAEQAEEPAAADQNESAEAVTEAEEPAAKEEVKEETASPQQKDSDSKEEKDSEVKEEKEDVKLLSKKKELTAEKERTDDFTISAVVDKDAEVPEDVFLQAAELTKDTEGFDYDKYYKDALKALKKDSDDVKGIKTIKFYDISLEAESQDESVEPKAAVNVKIAYDDGLKVNDADNVRIVHFAEQKDGEVKAEVLDSKENKVETTVNKKSEMTEASFDTEGFSVFAVAEYEAIETTYLTADGEAYKITVNFTKEAEIPKGSELVVREIEQGTSEYNDYRAKTKEALGLGDAPVAEVAEDDGIESVVESIAEGAAAENSADLVSYDVVNAQTGLTFIRLFDISIMHDGEEVEPKAPVEVVIKYDEPLKTDDGSTLDVVHFTSDGVEVVDNVSVNAKGTEITYEAESFSVYATAQSAVGEGDFIIYRDGNNDYAMNYNNGSTGRQSITISNNRVYSENDNVVWTFTAVTGGYRLSYVSNGTTYYLRNNNGNLATTTNVGQASTWTYSNRRLTSGNQSLNYGNSTFSLTNNGSDIYLAKLVEPATIKIHYVKEDGTELLATQTLPASTSTGVTAIRDIVLQTGLTYHNTYIGSDRATQIVPELRGAGGGTWEYQEYGEEEYHQFIEDTDIYVVYGDAYGSGSGGSGGGGGGDDPHIDTPSAGKSVTPNQDGTYNLALTITGEADSGGSKKGANVILILDTSNSMNTAVTGGGTRFTNAVSAAQSVSSNLLGMNTTENPNLVELCLVEFNKDLATSGWYTNAGTANPQGVYPEGTFNRKIADAVRNNGTNWEGALQSAITAANGHQDGDDTYIIFLTDGNPSTNATKDSRYDNEANNDTSSSYYYRISDNYMNATDEARQIVQSGWNFYSIGMYGNVDVLNYLTNFAYYGRSVNQTENKDTKSTYYFPAAETAQLIAALNNIADVISNSIALAGVELSDGIAKDVTHTALTTNLGSGSLGGVTYTKQGGSTRGYSVTVDSGGNAVFKFGTDTVNGSIVDKAYNKIVDEDPPTTVEATAKVYAATYQGTTYYMPIATVSEDGDFEWDLGPLGTLEKNASYTVNFEVWPDQDAYDYVTNLNNGIPGVTWDDAAAVPVYKSDGTTVAYYRNGVSQYPNIVKYPNGTFAAMSNTYQEADYYIEKVEQHSSGSTTTYVKGDPIPLDIPDPMVLTGTNFEVTKAWSDSLDPDQLTQLIEDAKAEGKVYGVTLELTEDGEDYKSFTFTPVWNETAQKYDWPPQTINIAPALLVSHYPGGGTYRTVTIDGTLYYVLNDGHEYLLEETDTDSHFEFNTIPYHPALIDGVLMNTAFEIGDDGQIVDGSTAEVVGEVPLQSFVGENTLRGGINIFKKVVEEDGTVVADNKDVFDAKVTLTVPMKDGEPDFSHVENYYDDDNVTILVPSVAWYRYYDDDDNVMYDDALIDAGILEDSGQTSQYGRIGQGENYDGSGWFYLDFDDITGTVTGTVKITQAYTLRFTNMAAGTTYNLSETGTHGMQPSYEFWHDNSSSTEKIVIGNAASNIRVTNKIVNKKVIVYKTDTEDPENPLANAEFTLYGNNLKSGENGYTAAIEIPVSATPYDLVETVAPSGYNKISNPVKVTVSSNGVTYIQSDYGGGISQTATKDADGNYVIQVRDNAGEELPMTGGIGTTIFYILGSLLAVGCGIVLIACRRAGISR